MIIIPILAALLIFGPILVHLRYFLPVVPDIIKDNIEVHKARAKAREIEEKKNEHR